MMPDETTIYCSKCSAFNIGSEHCICKDCVIKIIDKMDFTTDTEKERELLKIKLKEKLNCGDS